MHHTCMHMRPVHHTSSASSNTSHFDILAQLVKDIYTYTVPMCLVWQTLPGSVTLRWLRSCSMPFEVESKPNYIVHVQASAAHKLTGFPTPSKGPYCYQSANTNTTTQTQTIGTKTLPELTLSPHLLSIVYTKSFASSLTPFHQGML